jgi:hypothetical protein
MNKGIFVAALAVAAMTGCRGSQARGRQVIVLGVDAMDPGFLERHWGDLPNIARLRGQGGFRRLATTMPPQSPVAWSTFITGLDPRQHGIFDFVHRDPRTMQPFSSMSRTVEPRFEIPLGPYVLPLSTARVETLRAGEPFWRMLWDRHIPVAIMHMPNNFPPEAAGEAIAGMGADAGWALRTADRGAAQSAAQGSAIRHGRSDRGGRSGARGGAVDDRRSAGHCAAG